MNDIDFVMRTPERLSYQNATIQQFAGAIRTLANGVLGVVVMVAGYNVIFRPYLGSSYAGARELLPRLLLGGILVNTASWWTQLAIDVNNALCAFFGAGPPPNLTDSLARSMLPAAAAWCKRELPRSDKLHGSELIPRERGTKQQAHPVCRSAGPHRVATAHGVCRLLSRDDLFRHFPIHVG